MPQPDIFPQQTLPPGLVYEPDAITHAEEQALAARFTALDFKSFEFHGYLGNRRIVSYGARYDYAASRLREADPIPEFLFALRDRAAAALNVAPARIAHALITEYAPAPESDGIATSRSSMRSPPSLFSRPHGCGSGRRRAPLGNAAGSISHRALSMSLAANPAQSGSTASRR